MNSLTEGAHVRIISVLVFLAGIAVAIFMSPINLSEKFTAKKAPVSGDQKLREIVESYRADESEGVVTGSINILEQLMNSKDKQKEMSPQEICEVIDSIVVNSTQQEFLDILIDGVFEAAFICPREQSEYWEAFVSTYAERCTKKLLLEAEENKIICAVMFDLVKAHIAWGALQDKPLRDLEVEELALGTLANIDNPDKLEPVVNELVIRLPNSATVAKAALLPTLLRAGQDKMIESVIALKPKIDRALELDPDDESLLAFDMFIAIKNKEPGIAEELERYTEEHPESGLGLYYLASMKWKQKDKPETIRLLEEAVKRDPENESYAETLETVRTEDFEAKAFSLQLNFSYTDI
ncbi:MAG: hypothetical protein HRT45_10580 [Bdellovibrionales bacterium]|nr:hypothetical protein [Bdellovibrionales bacterium]